MTKLDRFRRDCRFLQMLVTSVLLGTAAILLLPYLILPLIRLWKEGAGGHAGRDLLLAWVRVAPGLCYLWALWGVRAALGELVGGRLFQPVVGRALRRIGRGVVAGALLSIFAVSNLDRVILHGHGGFAYFDLSGIVVAVVGATLMLLARLIDQAYVLDRELDGIV